MPDAPAPRFTPDGTPLKEWRVIAQYTPTKGVVHLSWTKEGSLWRRAQVGAIAYPESDLQDLIEGFSTQVQVLHHPSLF